MLLIGIVERHYSSTECLSKSINGTTPSELSAFIMKLDAVGDLVLLRIGWLMSSFQEKKRSMSVRILNPESTGAAHGFTISSTRMRIVRLPGISEVLKYSELLTSLETEATTE